MLLTGHPIRLTILDYGLFTVHANGRIIGLSGFLIDTDSDEHILIDTGMPAKYAHDAQAASAEDRLGSFGAVVALSPENLPAAQLGRVGLTLDDITLHIVSHTHIDHIGALHDVPAPILMARAERDLPKPLYWQGAQPMGWPDRTCHLIDADTDIGPGFRALLTPGHAPGQLAFELDLPQTGPVLLTSDAISRPSEVDEAFVGSWDADQALHHATRILARADQRGAFIVYGHCPRQWPNLRKAPQSYR